MMEGLTLVRRYYGCFPRVTKYKILSRSDEGPCPDCLSPERLSAQKLEFTFLRANVAERGSLLASFLQVLYPCRCFEKVEIKLAHLRFQAPFWCQPSVAVLRYGRCSDLAPRLRAGM